MKSRGREPRFVVDGMLGGLARRLRLLGYDAIYMGGVDDMVLLEVARSGSRVLLTCDRELYRAASSSGVSALYVDDADVDVVLESFGVRSIHVDPSAARCPHCNTPVTAVDDKDLVVGLVPAGVLRRHDVFYVCFGCGRVYWVGGHWRNIKKMERILDGSSEDER